MFTFKTYARIAALVATVFCAAPAWATDMSADEGMAACTKAEHDIHDRRLVASNSVEAYYAGYCMGAINVGVGYLSTGFACLPENVSPKVVIEVLRK